MALVGPAADLVPMVAAGLVPMFEAEAAERQAATRIKAGKAPTVSADLRSPGHGKAALKVVREAPEVAEQVRRGEKSVALGSRTD